jgi:hypothetical protein
VPRPLHCYAYIEARFDQLSRLLAEDAERIFQHATNESAEQAGTLSRTLKTDVGGFEVGREVSIEVGEFEPRGLMRSVVPLRWHAESGRLLFPELAAELEIAAVLLDPPLSQITINGSYSPPLGLLGAGADRLVLHRLAEATMHRFVHEVTDELRRMVEALPEEEQL